MTDTPITDEDIQRDADRLAEIRRWAEAVSPICAEGDHVVWLLQQLDAAQAERDDLRERLFAMHNAGQRPCVCENCATEQDAAAATLANIAERTDLRAQLDSRERTVEGLTRERNASACALVECTQQLAAAVALLRRVQIRDASPSCRNDGWTLGPDIIQPLNNFLAAPATARVVKRVQALEALYSVIRDGGYPPEISRACAAVEATDPQPDAPEEEP